jgi:hypothetical protein
MNRPHCLAPMHRLAPSPGNPVQHKCVLTSVSYLQFYGQKVHPRFSAFGAEARTIPEHYCGASASRRSSRFAQRSTIFLSDTQATAASTPRAARLALAVRLVEIPTLAQDMAFETVNYA